MPRNNDQDDRTTPMAPEEAPPAAPVPPPAEAPPDVEGAAYTEELALRRLIGSGGMGRVFLAAQKTLDREVAIKELRPRRPTAEPERQVARFLREARISGQLQHPGVVPIYELSKKADGTPFYVMKYVHGRTLLDALEDACCGREPEEALRERLKLLDPLISVCEAMGYAHAKRIIHRDLKPGNIILGDFGETVILDWGLAKRCEEPEPSEPSAPAPPEGSDEDHLTRVGARLGTPSYMSPEQIDPRFGEVGLASDVYALGTILFLILTGRKPYAGKGEEVMRQIADVSPSPSPRQEGVPISPELAAICEKAMAKDPQQRFQNASELAGELRAYRDGRLVGVYAYSRRELLRRFIARNKAAMIGTAAVLVAIVVGGAFAIHFAVEADAARARAENALVDVAQLSGDAVALSRELATSMEEAFGKLFQDMHATAARIAATSPAVRAKRTALLETLLEQQPSAAGFAIINADGSIGATAPPQTTLFQELDAGWQHALALKLSGHEEALSNPLLSGGAHAFAAAAKLPLGMVVGLFLVNSTMPFAFHFDTIASVYQVWCMEESGQIVYDEDPNQVGRYLFTDAMYANFPELLALGERIQKESFGVGYYRFMAKDSEDVIYKVAAWDATMLLPGTTWKVVVAYPYRVRKYR